MPQTPGNHYKYNESFPAKLVDHMKKGLSVDSFASLVGVSRETIYQWLKIFPEFKEAKELGEAHSLLFWEKMGIAGASGNLKGFNSKSWEFNMINRHKWVQKTEASVKHGFDGSGGNSPVVHIYLPDNGRQPAEEVEEDGDNEDTPTES